MHTATEGQHTDPDRDPNNGALVRSYRRGDVIRIGPNIRVKLMSCDLGRATIRVCAPKKLVIDREKRKNPFPNP